MDAPTMVANVLSIDNNFINMALDGLSDADLAESPSDQTNPIGWTLWHATRVEDGIISNISGQPQAWVAGGWHAKFGMDANPAAIGIGDPMEKVLAFKSTIADMKGYINAVREKTLAVLKTLSPSDLDRDLEPPGGGPARKVGDWLGVIMLDHFHHSGQACYVRGYLSGKGWFPR